MSNPDRTPGRHVYRAKSAPRRSTTPYWGSVITLGLMLVAAIALARGGWKPESIIGLLAAVAAAAGSSQLALSKVATVDERAQAIEGRTATIERQTNGEMTNTIHEAVHHAVAEHFTPVQRVDQDHTKPSPTPKGRATA